MDINITKFVFQFQSNRSPTSWKLRSIQIGIKRDLDVSNSKRMHPCLRYDFADGKIYKLLNEAYLARRPCLHIFFFRCKRRESPSNCRWEKLNQIQNFLWGRAYDVFDSKRMSNYIWMKSKIKFTTLFIYCCGFQFQVLCRKFLKATNSEDRPFVNGNNSAKRGANFLAEHWKHWTPISNRDNAFAVRFCRSTREALQIPLPTGLSRWSQCKQTITFAPHCSCQFART